MAGSVRFSADGQDYTRTLSMGTLTAISVSCWFKISVDRNTWSTPWFIDAGTGDNWGIQTSNDGTTMGVVDGGTTLQNMGSLTAGVWYYSCLVMNGATGTLFHKPHGVAALSAVAVSGGTADVSATTLRIGESPWGTEWLNGCIGPFKFWADALTAAEVAAEAAYIQPAKTAGLAAFYPFQRPDILDYSGNGRTLAGTGATYEDGPPLLERIVVKRWLSSAAAGGDLALADPSSGAVAAGALSDSPAVGLVRTDRADGVRAGISADAAALGTSATDPLAGAARAVGTTDVPATGLVLNDAATGTRQATTGDLVAIGVALADPLATGTRAVGPSGETATGALVIADSSAGALRSGNPAGELATTALVLTDSAAGAARAGTTASAITVDLRFGDAPTASRAGATADVAVASLLLPDRASGARAATTLGETATAALVALDPGTGQIRLATVGSETVAQGTGLTDPTVAGVRLGTTSVASAFGLVLPDAPADVRLGTTRDALAFQLLLGDVAGAARAGVVGATVGGGPAVAPTPPQRTCLVGYDDRTTIVGYDDRRLVVGYTTRTVEVT